MANASKVTAALHSFRALAAEARRIASSPVEPEYRELYRKIADHWDDLAREVENGRLSSSVAPVYATSLIADRDSEAFTSPSKTHCSSRQI